MSAESIDDVIRALDGIIERAWSERSRTGYFAALYRRVTRAVKDGIAGGRFQDGARMDRLDVVFANRYLVALDRFREGRGPSRSWRVAFDALGEPAPLVVQHLMAGMNAHINLDLGIAAAEIAPGGELGALEADFGTINALLAEQVGTVQEQLGRISPMWGLIQKAGLRTETRIINFSMSRARDFAWMTAQRVAATPGEWRETAIGALDIEVEVLGRTIVRPPLPMSLKLAPIRAAENNDVRYVLEVLAG